MKLQPFSKIASSTKREVSLQLTRRAERFQRHVELETLTICSKIRDRELAIKKHAASDDIDINVLVDMMDEVALLERRARRYQEVMLELFPSNTEKTRAP